MDPELVSAVARSAGGEKVDVAALCRAHGVSRQTFYKYRDRFLAEGAAGLTARSSAPRTRPSALGPAVAGAVVRTRQQLAADGWDHGPLSIRHRLAAEREHAVVTGQAPELGRVPSRATIHRILVDRGEIVPQPHKRPRARRRFSYADPNGCWQIDGLEHYLADGTRVCILQVIDDCSRMQIACHACLSESSRAARDCLEQAFVGHGLPVRLLSDNALAFSGKLRGRLAAVERDLAGHGVQAIASSPGNPQTCGKNERSHQTLQKWLAARPAPATLAELQTLLDEFRHDFNNNRPHQALDGQTPAQRYASTPKAAPDPDATGRAGTFTRTISKVGQIRLHGHTVFLGREWASQSATCHWQGDRVTISTHGHILAELTLDRSVRYQRKTKRNVSTTS